MDLNLLDSMLTAYRNEKTTVTFVLQNRTRISGTVRAFDNYVILLEGPKNEILYRHAVSSLAPAAAADAPRPAPLRTEQPPAPRPARPEARPPQKAAKQADKAPAKALPKVAAAPAEQSINTGMKEGLLRWMQEQKSSK